MVTRVAVFMKDAVAESAVWPAKRPTNRAELQATGYFGCDRCGGIAVASYSLSLVLKGRGLGRGVLLRTAEPDARPLTLSLDYKGEGTRYKMPRLHTVL